MPESKKDKKITVDVVYAFNFLNTFVPVFPGHAMPVSFKLEGFKQGDNEVTVSFYEDESMGGFPESECGGPAKKVQ